MLELDGRWMSISGRAHPRTAFPDLGALRTQYSVLSTRANRAPTRREQNTQGTPRSAFAACQPVCASTAARVLWRVPRTACRICLPAPTTRMSARGRLGGNGRTYRPWTLGSMRPADVTASRRFDVATSIPCQDPASCRSRAGGTELDSRPFEHRTFPRPPEGERMAEC